MKVKLIVTYELEVEDETKMDELKDMFDPKEILDFFKETSKTLIIEGL